MVAVNLKSDFWRSPATREELPLFKHQGDSNGYKFSVLFMAMNLYETKRPVTSILPFCEISYMSNLKSSYSWLVMQKPRGSLVGKCQHQPTNHLAAAGQVVLPKWVTSTWWEIPQGGWLVFATKNLVLRRWSEGCWCWLVFSNEGRPFSMRWPLVGGTSVHAVHIVND